MESLNECFDVIRWLKENFILNESNSATITYAGQNSMSFGSFPGIYHPFNVNRSLDVRVRGSVLDYGSVCADKNVLDFGSGDGFPSLLIAPFVKCVTGIDASLPRVNESIRNAKRLGINNAFFRHIRVGKSFPFAGEEFDCAVASWSLEQSPDATAIVEEIFRVLKSEGVFRFEPEPLWVYKNGGEQSVWLPTNVGDNHTITIVDRNLAEECFTYYGLVLKQATMLQAIGPIREKYGQSFLLKHFTLSDLDFLKPFIEKVGVWKTIHPSMNSWIKILRQIGFKTAKVTRSGGWYASRLNQFYPEAQAPKNIEELDRLLMPLARNAHQHEVSPDTQETCLFIHAIK